MRRGDQLSLFGGFLYSARRLCPANGAPPNDGPDNFRIPATTTKSRETLYVVILPQAGNEVGNITIIYTLHI